MHHNFIHGQSSKNLTKCYKTWTRIKTRCYDENNKDYQNYGGRGIRVCDRWLESFENFYEDIGDIPNHLSLDRIDNNKNYSRDNVRLATFFEQNYNRSNSKLITFNNKTQTMLEWANELGIKYGTLQNRLDPNRLNWSIEKALSHPVQLRRQD